VGKSHVTRNTPQWVCAQGAVNTKIHRSFPTNHFFNIPYTSQQPPLQLRKARLSRVLSSGKSSPNVPSQLIPPPALADMANLLKEIALNTRKTRSSIAPSAQPGTSPSDMASQRSRAPRGGARGGAHESGEEAQLWAEIREQLEKIKKHEDRAKDLRAQIFDMETKLKSQQDSEISKSRQRPFNFMSDRLV
jgi:hypothetical protein